MLFRVLPQMISLWLEAGRESRRITNRLAWGSQIWLVQRRLTSAERVLGELAWQQADFAADDKSARELQSTEKEQARLTFEIAEIREEFQDYTSLADAKKAVLEEKIAASMHRGENLELRLGQLRKLLVQEKARAAASYLIESEEKSIVEEEIALDSEKAGLSAFQESLAEVQNETREESERVQAVLKIMETRLDGLQQKKPVHFTRIGQELADVGIAPLNQPQVLDNVLFLRCQMASCQQKIRHSLQLRDSLSLATILLAWFILASVLCLVVALLFWVIF